MLDIQDKLNRLKEAIFALKAGDDVTNLLDEIRFDTLETFNKLKIVSDAGVALNRGETIDHVLEIILEAVRTLTNADGGTVYMVNIQYEDDPLDPGKIEKRELSFKVLQNESMNTFLGGTRGEVTGFQPVPLDDENGQPNTVNVSASCANTGLIINLPDVYHAEGFDFSGTKKYDEVSGYRSKSMLVIPLKDHENEIIGVLQLINRRNRDGEVVEFSQYDQDLVQSLAYQAAVSITSQRLLDEQKNLFDSFLKVIAEGIGEKSSHTFGHINKVAILTKNLSQAVHDWNEGMYKDITFTPTQMEELHLAGWMHDIGKMTTPEHVVSKQIKLQVVADLFEIVVERFNSKIKDIEIEFLNKKIEGMEQGLTGDWLEILSSEKDQKIKELVSELQVLNQSNIGGEFLAEEKREIIHKASEDKVKSYLDIKTRVIADKERIDHVELANETHEVGLLTEEEKNYLLISRGTLTEEERTIINDHADRSWRWLMKLPFPRKMIRLPLYAGAHHECLNGSGYPNNMVAEELPIQARIIAVADILEALVASDRPYKKPMSLSVAFSILGKMVKDGHLDPEVMKIFLKSGAYVDFAEKHMQPSQIDDLDVEAWLEEYYPSDFKNTLPE